MPGSRKLFFRLGLALSTLFVCGEIVFFLWNYEAMIRTEPTTLMLTLLVMALGGFAMAAFAVYFQRPLFAAMTRTAYERGDHLDYKPGWRVFACLLKIDRRGNYVE